MRGDPASIDVVSPRALPEALALLAADPALKPLAGGTDLMVLYAMGRLGGGRMLDLWRLDELRGIVVSDGHVTMGALTTYSDVQAHDVLAREFPMLGRAGSETGGLAIQNRGTLGGNLANASPAADSPPALMAYEAELELSSSAGARWVRCSDFYTGYKQTVMKPGELITRVRVPRSAAAAGGVHLYRKVGPRKAQAISKVCFAGHAEVLAGHVTQARIALGGVAPIIVRCRRAESLLAGRAPGELDADAVAAAVSAEISPIDDVRSTARYRRRVAENLTRQFVAAAQAALR